MCGNCNDDCDGTKNNHDVILGYGKKNGTKGCGVKWKYLSSQYAEGAVSSERLHEIRPDLELDRSII